MNQHEKDQLIALRYENIGRYFQRAGRMYSANALKKLRDKGYAHLTLFHTALIANLDSEGNRIQTMADRAGISKQAMGQLVKDLESQGYVQRASDPADKRATRIQFTDSGWQLLQDAYQVKLEIEEEYRAKLGEDGIIELRRLLKQLLDEIEP